MSPTIVQEPYRDPSSPAFEQLINELKNGPGETKIFEANGTWVKPATSQLVEVICIGGGGGGGGGAHGKAATICTGGGAGGGGAYSYGLYLASVLPGEVTITVEKKGAGGVSFATEKAGENGEAGGKAEFGEILLASGGELGKGGNVTGVESAGGTAATEGMYLGTHGGKCPATGEEGEAGEASTKTIIEAGIRLGGMGGGGGGGIPVAETFKKGGNGGKVEVKWTKLKSGAGATAEGEAGKAGAESSGWLIAGGGGGGASSKTAGGGAGGAGGKWGGGGGGGGATITASAFGGTGGNGGPAAVIVIAR